MRIIIYSKGKKFNKYKQFINWQNVVAIADKKAEKEETINDVPVILPERICQMDYDYVVVFSNQYYSDIRRSLIGEYFVDSERILSWRFLVAEDNDILDSFAFLKNMISELAVGSVLDMEMQIIPLYAFSVEEIADISTFIIDGIGQAVYPYYGQIYRNIYDNFAQIAGSYQLIYTNQTWEMDIKSFFKKVSFGWDYILMRFPYAGYSVEGYESLRQAGMDYADVQTFFLQESIYFLYTKKHTEMKDTNAKIYVVTHRNYNVNRDDLYCPICVGDYVHENDISESEGENISYLNDKINECTAMYWMWKNTSSEYVGLNHYRRYFYNYNVRAEGNYLNKKTIARLFQTYDIILPHSLTFNSSLEEQLQNTINEDAYIKGYNVINQAIKKQQPTYMDAFKHVMKGHKMFPCNMFVMPRKLFNEYCEWLFPFLIDAAESIDVSMYDKYSQRVIGFFAERMLTVWLTMHNFKVKEMPIDEWK